MRHASIGFDGPMASNRAAKWLADVAPGAPVAARVTSVLGLVSVAKSGVAVVPIPIALGDAEPELMRLFEPVLEPTRSWRILAHPDRRRTPAVAAFFDFITCARTAHKFRGSFETYSARLFATLLQCVIT